MRNTSSSFEETEGPKVVVKTSAPRVAMAAASSATASRRRIGGFLVNVMMVVYE